MIKFYGAFNPSWGRYEVHAIDHDRDGKIIAEADPIVFREVDDKNRHIAKPATMSIDRDSMQQFMDDLWQMGLRPSTTSSQHDLVESHKDHIVTLRESHEALIKLALRR